MRPGRSGRALRAKRGRRGWRGSTVFDVERLLHPLDSKTFKRAYWEKRPLRIKRGCQTYYNDLFSQEEFDDLLCRSSIRQGDIRVLSSGKEIPVQSLKARGYNGAVGALEYLYAQYRQGNSIAVNGITRSTRALRDFCQALAPQFAARVQVNSYLSPPNGQGLSTHYDTHDVFVLQICGAKHWSLREGPLRLPLMQHRWQHTNEPGPVIEEFDLEQGDLLYIPRGCVHTASANKNASLHLTVGVHPISWATVLNGVLQTAINEDCRFRESLPLAFQQDGGARRKAIAGLKELLEVLSKRVDAVAVIDDAAEAARRGTPPALDGHLRDLIAAESIDASTKLRRRSGMAWKLAEHADHVCLRFHGKEVKLPAHAAPALRASATGGFFSAGDLPGELDQNERLVLVKCLLKEGFFTLES
jgi:ribosomal protein L16 Arg81 hydroxylase